MEFIREDCIYARQSVDRKDSISIESQIEFCKYELKGGNCRVFKDKGYSGKNTDRPEFQKLLGEIRKGKVRRVIVYKLDRISRSILDFATMMELFQEYDVEFVSSTEKFDTSTPMGRAMLNICIVFAQLERETIQKRVTDAYYSRCLKGFHMSGQAPYGYQLLFSLIHYSFFLSIFCANSLKIFPHILKKAKKPITKLNICKITPIALSLYIETPDNISKTLPTINSL